MAMKMLRAMTLPTVTNSAKTAVASETPPISIMVEAPPAR